MVKASFDYLDQTSHNLEDNTRNLLDPRCLRASTANNDNLHYGQAMAAEDKDKFVKAMKKEIKSLSESNV